MEGMEAMEDYEQFGQVRVASERTKVYLFTITLDTRPSYRLFLQGYCTGSADPILRGVVLF